MSTALTTHAIYDILVNDRKIENPVFQVLEIKESRKGNKAPTQAKHYRMAICDGEYYTSAILNSSLTAKIENNELKVNTIFMAKNYNVNKANGAGIVIILKLDILDNSIDCYKGEHDPIDIHTVLNGNPPPPPPMNNNSAPLQQAPPSLNPNASLVSYPSNSMNQAPINQNPNIQNQMNQNSSHPLNNYQQSFASNSYSNNQFINVNNNNFNNMNNNINNNMNPMNNNINNNMNTMNNNMRNNMSNNMNNNPYLNKPANNMHSSKQNFFLPISQLNTYLSGWAIRVLVIFKSQISTYTQKFGANAGKQGQLFSVLLQDKDGTEIKATGFNNEVDRLYETFQVDHVYNVIGGRIKAAQFKSNNPSCSDFEITFSEVTKVEPVLENISIQLHYNFVPLDKILEIVNNSNMEQNRSQSKPSVDIIGVVTEIGQPTEVTSKKNDRILTKRSITICDDSETKCELTLWGQTALEFPETGNPIIAVKDCQIQAYMSSFSLSPNLNSVIKINPEIDKARQLRLWFNQKDPSSFVSISSGSFSTPSSLLAHVNERGYGIKIDKSDYFQGYYYLLEILLNRPLIYMACPNKNCKNKGLQLNDSIYTCPSCGQTIDNPNPRFAFTIKIGDATGSTYLSIIGEESMGKTILNLSAKEWTEQFEQLPPEEGEEKKRNYVQPLLFRLFKMKIRAKADNYMDKTKIKLTCVLLQEANYAEASKFFLSEIDKYPNEPNNNTINNFFQ